MQDVLSALSNTPKWVLILFIFLVIIGIKASKTRVVKIKSVFILPVIFTYMSVHDLIANFEIRMYEVSVWLAAILIGTLIGWASIYRLHEEIRIDKRKHLIQLPGTWVTLGIIFIIFASKYYFGYELSTHPEVKGQQGFELSMLMISGACTGLFVGRLLCYLYKYNTVGHTDLIESK